MHYVNSHLYSFSKRMRAVVNLLSYFATKRKRSTTLLVSTTGDTGPAAVQAISDANNPLLTILVHYPLGQISSFQRRQLTTADSPFVKVVAFEGGGRISYSFFEGFLVFKFDLMKNCKIFYAVHILLCSSIKGDDMDSPIKNILQSQKTSKTRMLCGVNSYNIGRPLMQMVHYVSASSNYYLCQMILLLHRLIVHEHLFLGYQNIDLDVSESGGRCW
jgi:threonine synthase